MGGYVKCVVIDHGTSSIRAYLVLSDGTMVPVTFSNGLMTMSTGVFLTPNQDDPVGICLSLDPPPLQQNPDHQYVFVENVKALLGTQEISEVPDWIFSSTLTKPSKTQNVRETRHSRSHIYLTSSLTFVYKDFTPFLVYNSIHGNEGRKIKVDDIAKYVVRNALDQIKNSYPFKDDDEPIVLMTLPMNLTLPRIKVFKGIMKESALEASLSKNPDFEPEILHEPVAACLSRLVDGSLKINVDKTEIILCADFGHGTLDLSVIKVINTEGGFDVKLIDGMGKNLAGAAHDKIIQEIYHNTLLDFVKSNNATDQVIQNLMPLSSGCLLEIKKGGLANLDKATLEPTSFVRGNVANQYRTILNLICSKTNIKFLPPLDLVSVRNAIERGPLRLLKRDINQFLKKCKSTLHDDEKIDRVVLAGGGTLGYGVKNIVQEVIANHSDIFRKEADKFMSNLTPQLAVCHGAASFATRLMMDRNIKIDVDKGKMNIRTVNTSMSTSTIGLVVEVCNEGNPENAELQVSVLIQQGETLPATKDSSETKLSRLTLENMVREPDGNFAASVKFIEAHDMKDQMLVKDVEDASFYNWTVKTAEYMSGKKFEYKVTLTEDRNLFIEGQVGDLSIDRGMAIKEEDDGSQCTKKRKM